MENVEVSKTQLVIEQVAQDKSSLSFLEEEEHQLKSLSLWLLAGDKNSAFFHRYCRSRLSRNHISKICTSGGEGIKFQMHLQQAVNLHF